MLKRSLGVPLPAKPLARPRDERDCGEALLTFAKLKKRFVLSESALRRTSGPRPRNRWRHNGFEHEDDDEDDDELSRCFICQGKGQ